MKKKLYFLFLKKNDVLSLSIVSAYTIYFIILGSLLDNMCIMNKQIRLNNIYDDKKICYNLRLIENLTLQDINYKYFYENEENEENEYKKILFKSFFNKLEVI